MYQTDDTIVAIATPPGRGGIGVVRISGPRALDCARGLTAHDTFEPRHATLVRVTAGEVSDNAIVTWFRAPHSYTGEEVVEISAHGSPVLLRAIVRGAMEAGARLAEPGEFTLRAYLSGRIDLVQAEAVRDLVDAVTPLQARAAFDQLEGTLTARIREIDATLFELSARLEASLDFAGEGYHFVEPSLLAGEIDLLLDEVGRILSNARIGRMVREGIQIAIVGRPNVGKSTLFNALLGAGRAIVTDIPGTTRDLLTEIVDIEGMAVTLVDTAGIRAETADAVEAEGVSRARLAASRADLTLVVLDRSAPLTDEDRAILAATAGTPRVIVANKSDLAAGLGPRGSDLDFPIPARSVRPPGSDLDFPIAPELENRDLTPGAPVALGLENRDLTPVSVSAATGDGLDRLRGAIIAALGVGEWHRDTPAITNLRHVALLERARDALAGARHAAAEGTPEEFVAADIADARAALEEITGKRTPDDTLNAIFARFCIGK